MYMSSENVVNLENFAVWLGPIVDKFTGLNPTTDFFFYFLSVSLFLPDQR